MSGTQQALGFSRPAAVSRPWRPPWHGGLRGSEFAWAVAFFVPYIAVFLGFVVYPEGGEIARHVHVPLERHLVGTSEVLVLRSGRCLIDIYDDDRQLVATRELQTGDIMLMVGGGHGFRMLEDTVFLEVKQGPYTGLEEKERF